MLAQRADADKAYPPVNFNSCFIRSEESEVAKDPEARFHGLSLSLPASPASGEGGRRVPSVQAAATGASPQKASISP